MGIIKCSNGHYYDNKKYGNCPYCTVKKKHKLALFDKTIAKFHNDSSDNVTIAYNDDSYNKGLENNDDEQLTISKSIIQGQNSPVTGWIVCIEGSFKGRSYEIRQGKNFVGRDVSMDIALLGEKSVTRNKHISIVFEPKKCETYIVPENGITYINEIPVNSSVLLNENDILSIGELKFIFVPYCDGERKW